ncbi:hypothetical protein TGPRC2_221455, partial [Toxoplasma gondii TgCatPRC2]
MVHRKQLMREDLQEAALHLDVVPATGAWMFPPRLSEAVDSSPEVRPVKHGLPHTTRVSLSSSSRLERNGAKAPGEDSRESVADGRRRATGIARRDIQAQGIRLSLAHAENAIGLKSLLPGESISLFSTAPSLLRRLPSKYLSSPLPTFRRPARSLAL